MLPQDEAEYLGHVKYEFDALYVLTQMIESRRFTEFPLDSFLLECCLAHFRAVWDFFYGVHTDALTVRDFLAEVKVRAKRPKQPERLQRVRKGVNSAVAHLGIARIERERKPNEPTMDDIIAIRAFVELLYAYFVDELTAEQKASFVNPLAHKFANYKML